MDLYVDGSGVRVWDRATRQPVAQFGVLGDGGNQAQRSHDRAVSEGFRKLRAEARLYASARLVAEAAQDLLRAAAADTGPELLGAAHQLEAAFEAAGLQFATEDRQALEAILRRLEAQQKAKTDGTDISVPRGASPGEKGRKPRA